MFKRDDHGVQSMPNGEPCLVQPDWSRKNKVEDIKTNILKVKGFLNAQQTTWWNSFFDAVNGTSGHQGEWLPPLFEHMPTIAAAPEVATVEQSPLVQAMSAERNIPKVCPLITYG